MNYENVLVEKRDQIGFITLNRPQAMNTFNVPLARELNDALWDMEKDPEVRVVVIDANGKHFSTGISLDEFKGKTPKEYREFIRLMDEHNHTIAKMKKPVIASVKGYALANGAGLSFACDLTVAAEDAKFGTTAINVGLICLGPLSPLARQIGKAGVYGAQDMPYHEGLDMLGDMFAALCSTEDAEEGVKAFLEKRKPEWRER